MELSSGQIIRPLILTAVCMTQVVIGTFIDLNYDPQLLKNLPTMLWYPVWFWLIGWVAAVSSFPFLLQLEEGLSAIWDCEDRGEISASEFNNLSGSDSDESQVLLRTS